MHMIRNDEEFVSIAHAIKKLEPIGSSLIIFPDRLLNP